MLMFDRFMPGAGWGQILLLALYAAWITPRMLDPLRSPKWRLRIWLLFTFVFFGQLLLGLLGLDIFLMTGKLHLPVPAMIIAGPVYRGDIGFMPILFLSTVLLVGPAWCSRLCYVGAWDEWASRGKRLPGPPPKHPTAIRASVTLATVAMALIFRLAGAPPVNALIFAAAFGLVGVGFMIFVSRRTGRRVHCIYYCPVGLVADILGKINPFRLTVSPACTLCRVCTSACRCDALTLEDLKRRKPGLSCTLCGDCIGRCRHGHLEFTLYGRYPRVGRAAFTVLTVSLHAAFLGLARI